MPPMTIPYHPLNFEKSGVTCQISYSPIRETFDRIQRRREKTKKRKCALIECDYKMHECHRAILINNDKNEMERKWKICVFIHLNYKWKASHDRRHDDEKTLMNSENFSLWKTRNLFRILFISSFFSLPNEQNHKRIEAK